MTDGVPLLPEGGGQLLRTLAGPAQRRHRVAAGERLDQGFQIVQEGRVRFCLRLPPAAGAPDPGGARRALRARWPRRLQFADPLPDALAAHPGCLGHQGDAAAPERQGLGRHPQPTDPLVHRRPQRRELLLNHLEGAHSVIESLFPLFVTFIF